MLFDIIEYYDCTIDKTGNYLLEDINGELKIDNRISGNPEINVFLSLPN